MNCDIVFTQPVKRVSVLNLEEHLLFHSLHKITGNILTFFWDEQKTVLHVFNILKAYIEKCFLAHQCLKGFF